MFYAGWYIYTVKIPSWNKKTIENTYRQADTAHPKWTNITHAPNKGIASQYNVSNLANSTMN